MKFKFCQGFYLSIISPKNYNCAGNFASMSRMNLNDTFYCCIPFHITCRLKRNFAHQDITNLLKEKGITSGDLMPVADTTSRSLINNNNNGGKTPSPTFPSFLPLEVFDNTEYDCRTPEEWLALGTARNERERKIQSVKKKRGRKGYKNNYHYTCRY